LILAVLLGAWGWSNLEDSGPRFLASGYHEPIELIVGYLGLAKIFLGLLLAAICIGFDGLMALGRDMRARHPGKEPRGILDLIGLGVRKEPTDGK
jgi:hypothetical protein